MLVLTRKVGEEIVIGEEIRLTVIEIRGSRAKLGLTAPRHIAVRREELTRLAVAALEEEYEPAVV